MPGTVTWTLESPAPTRHAIDHMLVRQPFALVLCAEFQSPRVFTGIDGLVVTDEEVSP